MLKSEARQKQPKKIKDIIPSAYQGPESKIASLSVDKIAKAVSHTNQTGLNNLFVDMAAPPVFGELTNEVNFGSTEKQLDSDYSARYIYPDDLPDPSDFDPELISLDDPRNQLDYLKSILAGVVKKEGELNKRYQQYSAKEQIAQRVAEIIK